MLIHNRSYYRPYVQVVYLNGQYKLGDFVVVEGGTARLMDESSLAGSILRLFEGVKNVFDWVLYLLKKEVRMAQKTQLALWN